MITMTLPQKNGSVPAAPSDTWLQSSVQKFFSSFNWEDNTPEVQEIKLTSQENSGPLSLTLSVNQFFAAVNWDGAAIAPATSASLSQPTSATLQEDLTLDGFSDFFG
jgi:hypothetical protein